MLQKIALIICLFLAGAHTSCIEATSEATPIKITHHNVVIAPDLSNRLTKYKRPVDDIEIIDSIIALIYPKIAKAKRKMHQADRYQLDLINEKQISEYGVNPSAFQIDLQKFENQGERIRYLMGNEQPSFTRDLKRWHDELKQLVDTAKQYPLGSDIWSYLNSGVNGDKVDTSTWTTQNDKQIYLNHFQNTLVLFTDGYIENDNRFSDGKKKSTLTQSEIEQFRAHYNKDKRNRTLQQFFEEEKYGIVPLNNRVLNNLDVLVLEMYDRSKTIGGATVYPTDFEIMKIFWRDWFLKSGIKKFEFCESSKTGQQAQQKVLSFLGVQ